MKPLSDLTTPRRLMAPISRHFFPVEQPEPPDCCTTGLKNGSRLPLMAHFFSSGLGCLGASAVLRISGEGFTTTGAAALTSFTAGCLEATAPGFAAKGVTETVAFAATAGLAST